MDAPVKDYIDYLEKLREDSFGDKFLNNFLAAINYIIPSQYLILISENHLLKELDIKLYKSVNNEIQLLVHEYQKSNIEKALKDYFHINYPSKIIQKDCSDKRNTLKIFSKEITFATLVLVPLFMTGKKNGCIILLNEQKSEKISDEELENLISLSLILSLYLENVKLKEENVRNQRLSVLGQSIINSAHGLKNLLNNIDGGVFIVEKGTLKKDMDEVAKGWEILRRNSNRVRDLVLDILLFSRPKKPEYKNCDINNICKDIKELVEQRIKNTDVELCLNLDTDIGELVLDPKGIYRAILNLVSNAIFACEEKKGGRVTIKTRIKDKMVIEVSDTGTGISKENLDNIFNTFFTTKGSMGTGLGLSVTKKIISEHKGTIEVKSLLNVGTTFIIKLPLEKPS